MIRVDFSPEQFKVAIATSVIVFGFDGENLKILLEKKSGKPFEGAWIVPSSVVNVDEDTTNVARRLLKKHDHLPEKNDHQSFTSLMKKNIAPSL